MSRKTKVVALGMVAGLCLSTAPGAIAGAATEAAGTATDTATDTAYAVSTADARAWRVTLSDGTEDVWRVNPRTDVWRPVAGTVPSVDVVGADLRHARRRVKARVQFADLVRQQGRVSVWAGIDVGPEFRYARVRLTPSNRAGRARLFQEPGVHPMRCAGLRYRVSYRNDVVRVSVPRSCLGRPDWVRVNVTVESEVRTGRGLRYLVDNPHSAEGYDNRGSRRLYRRP